MTEVIRRTKDREGWKTDVKEWVHQRASLKPTVMVMMMTMHLWIKEKRYG